MGPTETGPFLGPRQIFLVFSRAIVRISQSQIAKANPVHAPKIGHLRVPETFTFKTRLSAKNKFYLLEPKIIFTSLLRTKLHFETEASGYSDLAY